MAQLFLDQFNAIENPYGVVISNVDCNNGILSIDLEGSLLPDSDYTISLRNIMGTDTYTNSISDMSQNFNVNGLSKGMYVVVLSINGVEIDSRKIVIK